MKKLSSKDKIIHDQFYRYGQNAKEWMNKCVLLLPKIEKNRIWEKKGFLSIHEYAAKLSGMSRNKVNEGLRILKKTENLPAIQEVIKEKGIFAVKPVVNIVTKETEQVWAKRALKMKKSTLETFVRDYRKEQREKSQENFGSKHAVDNNLQTSSRPGAGSLTDNNLNKPNLLQKSLDITGEKDLSQNDKKIQISMKLDWEIVDKLKEIKGEGDWNQTMEKLLKYSQKELKAEQKYLEAKEKRSKGRCEHPNCNKPGKHIHHLEPFAIKKEHDPDKLIYLCEEHHQIIHFGYIDDSRIMPGIKRLTIEQSSMEPIINSWKQIEKLPIYDFKNVINKRIAEFRRNHNSQQFTTQTKIL